MKYAVVFLCFAYTASAAIPLIESWGENSLRIRMVLGSNNPINHGLPGPLSSLYIYVCARARVYAYVCVCVYVSTQRKLPGALDEQPPLQQSTLQQSSAYGFLTNGNIKADYTNGSLSITRVSDGEILLRSLAMHIQSCGTEPTKSSSMARKIGEILSSDEAEPTPEGCATKAVVSFSWSTLLEAYGTGQHMNTHAIPGRLPPGRLNDSALLPSINMVGASWDFESCTVYSDSSGAEICIPWVIAATPPTATANNIPSKAGSFEYGFLWNMPNFGSMTIGKNESTWVAHDPTNQQIDFFVTTYGAGMRGTSQAAKAIMKAYVDATGHAPVMTLTRP